MKEDFYGVIVYEIIESAGYLVLNGIYSNTGNGKPRHDLPFMVNNEIAKKPLSPREADILVGTYESRYIDSTLVDCTLEIKIVDEAYDLRWSDKRREIFKGIGLRVGKHLSVSYVKGEVLK